MGRGGRSERGPSPSSLRAAPGSRGAPNDAVSVQGGRCHRRRALPDGGRRVRWAPPPPVDSVLIDPFTRCVSAENRSPTVARAEGEAEGEQTSAESAPPLLEGNLYNNTITGGPLSHAPDITALRSWSPGHRHHSLKVIPPTLPPIVDHPAVLGFIVGFPRSRLVQRSLASRVRVSSAHRA